MEALSSIKKKCLESPSALTLKIVATYHKARATILTLPHGEVFTPVYMPVGTKGCMKCLTFKDLESINCRIMLSNTYHIAIEPSGDHVEKCGGLHHYMGWNRNLLTDSGGFQMVSLKELMKITEEGVVFKSHVDEKEIVLKPEDSMHLQNQIGSDIMMALDDVISTLTTGPRVKEACERSVRWLDRCIKAHKNPEKQNLFGIIQGSVYPDLRKYCLTEMIKRNCPGYAIGGLAGGEEKEKFWRTVSLCTDYLPTEKPRYLMGVGYPVDLVVCACLGVDMFDCVFATRTARFGTGFTKKGFIKLKHKDMAEDFKPIDEKCKCDTCKSYTRALLNKTISNGDTALLMISLHNVYFLLNLMSEVRQSIIDGNLPTYVNSFINEYFEVKGWIPAWVIRALKEAKIEITTKLNIKEEEDNEFNQELAK